ncbi:MAG: hypothetical protein KGJ34_01500 [Patescibacteria group bacterium]|nr:hypothetical protein [Patescibacteria group bacterium]
MGVYKFIRSNLLAGGKTGLEAYFVLLVWAFFFFLWLPGHLQAQVEIFNIFMAIIPFVLPFLIGIVAYHLWYEYQWARRYGETEHCVLEIKLPEEITQTPYAAELMLRGIYQTGETDTPLHEFLGATKPWFSLEIVSTEGRVHFYMWMRRRYKALVEAQIYAHYPTVQVVEVPDYTLSIPYDPAVVDVWAVEQKLQKPDPYPILTYVEAGLDEKGVKEEFKHDPQASLIELLGSIKEGEHIWIQFVIRAHVAESYCPYALEETHHHMNLREWGQHEIETIAKKVTREKEDGTGSIVNYAGLTKGDRELIESIQNKLNKQPFEVGIRAVYIARKDKSNSAPRIAIPSAFRSFEHGSEGRGLNGLAPIFWIGPFNFAWQDFMNTRRHMLWKRMYDAYVTRQFFYPPHKHRWIILNSEELATIYHFPGKVVRTPTLERMPSKRAEAPANLPI